MVSNYNCKAAAVSLAELSRRLPPFPFLVSLRPGVWTRGFSVRRATDIAHTCNDYVKWWVAQQAIMSYESSSRNHDEQRAITTCVSTASDERRGRQQRHVRDLDLACGQNMLWCWTRCQSSLFAPRPWGGKITHQSHINMIHNRSAAKKRRNRHVMPWHPN